MLRDDDSRRKEFSKKWNDTYPRKRFDEPIDYKIQAIHCLSKFQLNNVSGDKHDDIEREIENLTILIDQFKSISQVQAKEPSNSGWRKVSLTVDLGACDIVVDPMGFLGYELAGVEASRAGEVFPIASGDPIPQLGRKNVVICSESDDIRTLKAQCSIVQKPLPSVKGMAEVGKFVGFCEQDGFRS